MSYAGPLVECVPNFSEGRDDARIAQITEAIAAVPGARLLDVDPGRSTHRTVVTFVGPPEAVVEAAFQGIRRAAELIDMRSHRGEHPRMGATDVCPLVPVAGITMDEVVALAQALGRRVGEELGIPVYLYERAATRPERRNLASIRAGEYEGLAEKLAQADWAPDFGPATFNPRSGATVIGARDFLVAYNINLNTTSTRRAFALAYDLREQGRIQREGDPVVGTIVRDAAGEPVWIPGELKAVKAIGWYIPEYGIAQVSMNLTDLEATPLHLAFEAACRRAEARGMRVTGSELVGMVPLRVLQDAGRYFLHKQERSAGVSEAELLKIAVKSLGLDDLAPFDPAQKIIEHRLREPGDAPLVGQTLMEFADAVASEAPAPGGGSVAAYLGALAAALGAMVANVSAHKRGWDARWRAFSDWAERGQERRAALLRLVDADTRAFEAVMAAWRMPQGSAEEREAQAVAVEAALKAAIDIPFAVMTEALATLDLLEAMAAEGAPASRSDAAVGALCARAAVAGAYLNVKINAPELKDRAWVEDRIAGGAEMLREAEARADAIVAAVEAGLGADG